ncbi:hypothetical protein K4F52_005495 [Lecanicillium sp. MT-2017a]|nr:hypothetical protein K4F52_005495 [Lecanicillium sp. MT-2017a]
MAPSTTRPPSWRTILAGAMLFSGAFAADLLKTSGFTDCGSDASVKVDKVDITYDNDKKTVVFDFAGSSSKEQNVTAVLKVTAYGNEVYSNSFNPCDKSTFVEQLCPLPVGDFAASGSQQIPAEFADMVPGIAFQIPDIAAQATLKLKSLDGGDNVACITSQVSNGKTANVPAVSYVAAGIAGAALIVSGASAASAAISGASTGGAGTISPSFTEVFGWFQGMAMNGMLSVNYPPVYRSFAKNFAFSTGVIPWTGLQSSIDSFRAKTGGNLTHDNVEWVKKATMVYPDGSTGKSDAGIFQRSVTAFAAMVKREVETSVNGTDDATEGDDKQPANFQETVQGIQAYAQQLTVPKSDLFMTALLVVAIVIGAIVVGILLVKVILEAWAIWGTFPKSLQGFRKHYWGSIARTITSLILLLYGVWVLYCIFQFTHGDSWAAKTLAGVTLAIFTAILAFFSWKIWSTVRKLKATEGDTSGLYEKKEIWIKYSLFYDAYRKSYWWLFVPVIFYMFAKGFTIAAADGHGMQQTIAQLVIEAIMLILLLWSRPYERRSGNIINIVIQVVRVLSVGCILIFVDEFAIAQTTQTVAGVALIVVQSTLTGILAILIIWNGINACCKANPHRQRRKELEKRRDFDTLTPLDARNSLLLLHPNVGEKSTYSIPSIDNSERRPLRSESPDRYYPDHPTHGATRSDGSMHRLAPGSGFPYRPLTPSNEPAATARMYPSPPGRNPTVPDLEGGRHPPQQEYRW